MGNFANKGSCPLSHLNISAYLFYVSALSPHFLLCQTKKKKLYLHNYSKRIPKNVEVNSQGHPSKGFSSFPHILGSVSLSDYFVPTCEQCETMEPSEVRRTGVVRRAGSIVCMAELNPRDFLSGCLVFKSCKRPSLAWDKGKC